MKIATVTWITYRNYGTELQAYALQQFILRLGFENDIVSDKRIVNKDSDGLDSNTRGKRIGKKKKSYWIKKLLKNVYRPRKVNGIIKSYIAENKVYKSNKLYFESQKKIEEFKKDHLYITKDYSRDQMIRLNDVYDFFIAGSDQIWSPLDCNFDGYYFLDFVNGNKKGAYAPSFGTPIISKKKQEIITEYLSSFTFCSVREKQSTEQISHSLGIKAEWVCDPTLLFDKSFWVDFGREGTAPKCDYILCYFLDDREWYFNYAKSLANYLGLKLVLIPSREGLYMQNDLCEYPVGPIEFVGLFMHSTFVLTDSYHGTIFSLIFQKQMLHLKRFNDSQKDNQNIRVYSLLEYLGLKKLIIEENKFKKNDLQTIDYSEINALLKEHSNHSKRFLIENLKSLF